MTSAVRGTAVALILALVASACGGSPGSLSTSTAATTTSVTTTPSGGPGYSAESLTQSLGMGEAFCVGGFVAAEKIRTDAMERPADFDIPGAAFASPDGCNRAVDPVAGVSFVGGPPVLPSKESAFCSGWVRVTISFTVILYEAPDQLGVFETLFDACMGGFFGLGRDYYTPTEYRIFREGLCLQEGSLGLTGDDGDAIFPCPEGVEPEAFARSGLRPDAGQCVWYEQWIERHLVDVEAQLDYERDALSAAGSGAWTTADLAGYYTDSVLPWWGGLGDFVADADPPIEYGPFHEAIAALVSAHQERASNVLVLDQSPEDALAQIAEIEDMGEQLLVDTHMREIAQLDCGLSRETIADPDAAASGLAAVIAQARSLDETSVLSDFGDLQLANLAYRFCQSAEETEAFDTAFSGLFRTVAWLQGNDPPSIGTNDGILLEQAGIISTAAVLNSCPHLADAYGEWLG